MIKIDIMEKLELYCTYAEWKRNGGVFQEEKILRNDERLLELHTIEMVTGHLSSDERKEMDELNKQNDIGMLQRKYTNLCHEITDKCLNPVGADIDYEEIGRLQCEVERLKYPCVLPEDEMNDKD